MTSHDMELRNDFDGVEVEAKFRVSNMMKD